MHKSSDPILGSFLKMMAIWILFILGANPLKFRKIIDRMRTSLFLVIMGPLKLSFRRVSYQGWKVASM